MEYQNIIVERDDRIYTITINRPNVMNALDPVTHAEMSHAFNEFENTPDLWVAILTGSGDSAFCAGGDISAMVDAKSEDDYKVPETGYGGLTNRFSCDKPIIAAVNGLALGGGFELALSSDIVIASDKAIFGLPEPKICPTDSEVCPAGDSRDQTVCLSGPGVRQCARGHAGPAEQAL